MFAIAFDLNINDLKATYGEPYNNAYYEIKNILRKYDFYNTQGSVYLTQKNDMATLFRAMFLEHYHILLLGCLGKCRDAIRRCLRMGVA